MPPGPRNLIDVEVVIPHGSPYYINTQHARTRTFTEWRRHDKLVAKEFYDAAFHTATEAGEAGVYEVPPCDAIGED